MPETGITTSTAETVTTLAMPTIAPTRATTPTVPTLAITPIAPMPVIVRTRRRPLTAATGRSLQPAPRRAPSADPAQADRPGRRAIADVRAPAVAAGNNAVRLRLAVVAAVAVANGDRCTSAL